MTAPIPGIQPTKKARGIYKKYSLQNKLKIINRAQELHSITAAKVELGFKHLDNSMIGKWIKNKAKIAEAVSTFSRQHEANKFRCEGGGRKPKLGDHELEIYEEIMDLRRQKFRVTRKKVFKIAINVAERHHIVGFQGTSRWIKAFFRRWRLSLRRQSSLQTLNNSGIIE